MLFADATPDGYHRTFVALDPTIYHNYGFSMIGGQVSYTIDGVHYDGTAVASGSRILVIGDGSGSSPNGSGSMRIARVSIDNDIAALPAVPEPASWAMMAGGFGLLGAALRRRARTPAIA
jgi:hypothetical protein